MHIADYDRFGAPLPTLFLYMALTPDNRIFMNTSNGTQYLHVIQNPNERGLESNFTQHAIKLPTINFLTFPNFPNYRLSAINSSYCDSLNAIIDSPNTVSDVSIFPNPSSGIIYISGPENPIQYEIYNLNGMKIQNGVCRTWEILIENPGIYLLNVFLKNKWEIKK